MKNIVSFFYYFVQWLFNKPITVESRKQTNENQKISREEVLCLIENNGGPIGLDLSYRDFSNVDLSNINFGGNWLNTQRGTNFEGSKFKQSNLKGCNLDVTNFQNAYVLDSDLSNASFRGANCNNTNFRKSNFKYVNFYRTQFTGADFYQAKLQLTDFYKTKNLKDAILDKSNFGEQILQESESNFIEYLAIHNLGNNEQALTQRFLRASDIYLHIKNSFSQQGRYENARWAYLKERRTFRSAINPFRIRKNLTGELEENARIWNWKWWWFYIKFSTKWILSWLEDFSCGYGELPSKTIFLSLVIILIFPVIYRQTGGIEGAFTCLDYFNYSFGAFTTIGFDNLTARTPIAQTLTSMEALIGISMLALLMYTLGNRISRS